MSFILDALKKSENKRRKKAQQLPRSIHEPVAYKIPRPRSWMTWILVVLILNVVVLGWFAASWWKDADQTTSSLEQQVLVANDPPAAVDPVEEPKAAERPAELSQSARVKDAAFSDQAGASKSSDSAALLPVPRTDKRVYDYQQLPTAIQRQIPELKMALHAYDRQNPQSSMVQLNGQIYRARDHVDELLLLEEITEKGVILRYDGYRFLLPRRRH